MNSYKVFGHSLIKEATIEIENEKKKKKEKLNFVCQNLIVFGFHHEVLGKTYHFSYDQETQLNFQDTYNLFQNNLLKEIGWTVRFEGEKIRIQLDKESFSNVYIAAIKHKNEILNHFYKIILPSLEKAQSVKEIQSISWGKQEESLLFDMKNTLDKKLINVDTLGKETQAQKGQNAYMESTIMEVADLIFGSM